jgi:hypothetical protein
MCLDSACPSREHCLRFTAHVSDGWQSYGEFNRAIDADKCIHFVSNGNTHYAMCNVELSDSRPL